MFLNMVVSINPPKSIIIGNRIHLYKILGVRCRIFNLTEILRVAPTFSVLTLTSG